MRAPRRGEVYWTALDPVVGSEQGGTRPAVVVQNDLGNERGRTTIIVPVSSKVRLAGYPFVARIPDGVLPRPSIVNCGHVRNVDRSRLIGEPIALLDEVTMLAVDEALRVSLGLW